MRANKPAILAAALFLFTSGSGCAMSGTSGAHKHCRVVGGELLPPSSGGADALCTAIEQATSAQPSKLAYSVEVHVLSASRMSATITAGGRKLPEQKYAISDGEIGRASFQRFADAIAAALHGAEQR
jgi:hypothetical protein